MFNRMFYYLCTRYVVGIYYCGKVYTLWKLLVHDYNKLDLHYTRRALHAPFLGVVCTTSIAYANIKLCMITYMFM